jgi:hypothetical protein
MHPWQPGTNCAGNALLLLLLLLSLRLAPCSTLLRDDAGMAQWLWGCHVSSAVRLRYVQLG